jgi:putative heme iron utilization protein
LFGPDVVAAVCRHMNEDHPEDSLLIVRTLGEQPNATDAVMTGVDADGADFEATVDGRAERVRLPFSRTLTERRQIRLEVVGMYEEACAAAGQVPRTAAPH